MNKRIIKILFKRLISSLIILFLLISFIFILLRISPGSPVQKFISPELSPELAEKVKESFMLNGSVIEQYFVFISNLIQGDLGISYVYRIPVLEVLIDFLIFTLIFSLISFTIQIVCGFSLALITSKHRNSFMDRSVSNISLMIYSTPAFVLAVLLIYIFSIQIDILPTSDLRSLNFSELNFFEQILDYTAHLILPLLTLSLGGIVIFYKYLRDNLDSIFKKTFVLNLKAEGIAQNEILWKHVIPNAIGPMISIAGIELGLLFSGALITEVIFGLPGMGRLTIQSILVRDYPLVIGCTFISGVLIILSNFIADLIKVKIDKRLLHGILN
jgi:peptide/nickel transport system permease protein